MEQEPCIKCGKTKWKNYYKVDFKAKTCISTGSKIGNICFRGCKSSWVSPTEVQFLCTILLDRQFNDLVHQHGDSISQAVGHSLGRAEIDIKYVGIYRETKNMLTEMINIIETCIRNLKCCTCLIQAHRQKVVK